MAKGQGAILYVDVDSDDQYVAVSCIYNLKPSGLSRGTSTEEPCLGDTASFDDTGDLKYTPLTGSLQADPNGTVQATLETAITNDTDIQWAIKHPLSTPIYQFGSGKLSELEPQGFERESQMKIDIELLPSAAYTYSTTAPTLEA